ncbi:MAG: hypothetical protein F6J90_26210 [Moorea sp. SIOASIH]|uniref:hypothetical protein n=1 Tax=Moorena sp. SIOASIH TaxID=2607817 RepID=UPI0013BDB79B|nr:hypothetical protein [Moorena sp. SIOASIH]NEO39635.1 hypothetical protein [Moorena sp. SIOASIH]
MSITRLTETQASGKQPKHYTGLGVIAPGTSCGFYTCHRRCALPYTWVVLSWRLKPLWGLSLG